MPAISRRPQVRHSGLLVFPAAESSQRAAALQTSPTQCQCEAAPTFWGMDNEWVRSAHDAASVQRFGRVMTAHRRLPNNVRGLAMPAARVTLEVKGPSGRESAGYDTVAGFGRSVVFFSWISHKRICSSTSSGAHTAKSLQVSRRKIVQPLAPCLGEVQWALVDLGQDRGHQLGTLLKPTEGSSTHCRHTGAHTGCAG